MIILIVFCFMIFSCKQEQKRQGQMNLKKIKLIEIGMDTLKMKEIMGKPDTAYTFKGEFFYDYVLPPNTSGQLTLVFDSTGKLIFKGNIPTD